MDIEVITATSLHAYAILITSGFLLLAFIYEKFLRHIFGFQFRDILYFSRAGLTGLLLLALIHTMIDALTQLYAFIAMQSVWLYNLAIITIKFVGIYFVYHFIAYFPL